MPHPHLTDLSEWWKWASNTLLL